MRLRHTDLITGGALPQQQLTGEWRELNAIFKAKWQLICGLLGAACVICAAVMIFIMF